MGSRGWNVLVMAFAVLCQCAQGLAIPADAELIPSKGTFLWGAQVNHIGSRDFNKVEGEARTTQYFVKGSYGITDRLFLDGKLGMGDVSFDRTDGLSLDFDSGFAGGYGFRYMLFDDKKLKLQFGFQHISCHPFKIEENGVDHRIIWDEWQGTIAAMKELGAFTLYAGPQYSAVQLKYEEADLRRRVKAEDVWGGFAGMWYRCSEDGLVNVSMRAGAEWAWDIGIHYAF